MIKSMTGFASASAAAGGLTVGIEIRTYNSRNLDIALRLPAGIIMHDLLSGQNRVFLRSQLMTAENLNVAVKIATSVSHKKRPLTPEQTLQKTIQRYNQKVCK